MSSGTGQKAIVYLIVAMDDSKHHSAANVIAQGLHGPQQLDRTGSLDWLRGGAFNAEMGCSSGSIYVDLHFQYKRFYRYLLSDLAERCSSSNQCSDNCLHF